MTSLFHTYVYLSRRHNPNLNVFPDGIEVGMQKNKVITENLLFCYNSYHFCEKNIMIPLAIEASERRSLIPSIPSLVTLGKCAQTCTGFLSVGGSIITNVVINEPISNAIFSAVLWCGGVSAMHLGEPLKRKIVWVFVSTAGMAGALWGIYKFNENFSENNPVANPSLHRFEAALLHIATRAAATLVASAGVLSERCRRN